MIAVLNLILVLYVTSQVIWIYFGIVELIELELNWYRFKKATSELNNFFGLE